MTLRVSGDATHHGNTHGVHYALWHAATTVKHRRFSSAQVPPTRRGHCLRAALHSTTMLAKRRDTAASRQDPGSLRVRASNITTRSVRYAHYAHTQPKHRSLGRCPR